MVKNQHHSILQKLKGGVIMNHLEIEDIHGETNFEHIQEIHIYNQGALQIIGQKEPKRYRVSEFWDEIKLIRNGLGEVVSNDFVESFGYISFDINNKERRIYYAQTGAIRHILIPPTENNPKFTLATSKFHNIIYRPNLGLVVGQRGAIQYFIDPLTGDEVDPGYHKIYQENGRLFGIDGAITEEILESDIPKIET